MEIKEYKKKLGYKINSWTFLNGKETFAMSIYENGFVLKKRKQIIVLDLFELLRLKDLVESWDKKRSILKQLE